MSWLSDSAKGTKFEDKISAQSPAAKQISETVDEERGWALRLKEQGVDLESAMKGVSSAVKIVKEKNSDAAYDITKGVLGAVGFGWLADVGKFVVDTLVELFGGPGVAKITGDWDPSKAKCKPAQVYEEYAEQMDMIGKPVPTKAAWFKEYLTDYIYDMVQYDWDPYHSWMGSEECPGLLRRMTDYRDVGFDPSGAQGLMRMLEDATGGRFLNLELKRDAYRLHDEALIEWPEYMPIGQPAPLSQVYIELYGAQGFREPSDIAAIAFLPLSFGLPNKPIEDLTQEEKGRYWANGVVILAANNADNLEAFWSAYEELLAMRKTLGFDGWGTGAVQRRAVNPELVKENIAQDIYRATAEMGRRKGEIRSLFKAAQQQKALKKKEEEGEGEGGFPAWVWGVGAGVLVAGGAAFFILRRKKRKK